MLQAFRIGFCVARLVWGTAAPGMSSRSYGEANARSEIDPAASTSTTATSSSAEIAALKKKVTAAVERRKGADYVEALMSSKQKAASKVTIEDKATIIKAIVAKISALGIIEIKFDKQS